jgi:cobalt/nickel transport system ATP-binding protein
MAGPLIEARGLSYTYPDGTVGLRQVDFSLEQGETVGLIGANGAGKSTFILHLNGVLRGEGEVCIGGEKLDKRNLRRVRARVGIVFQDPNDQLFMPTIFDDVAFGPLSFGLSATEVEEKVNGVLQDLGLYEVRGKPPHHLSLGERKRAALATVLVMEPDILVLDEPSVSLDPGTRRLFIRLIRDLEGAKIIASHDLDLVYELCSRVVLLDRGRVIAGGPTAEILKDQELLEAHSLEVPLSITTR